MAAAMARHRARAGDLAGAIDHFCKVTRSYRPGLFHCYAVPELPRTNNGLEQLFGSQRHHERRATGRKMASPAAVLRGEVRLIAATATRLHPPEARDLNRVYFEKRSFSSSGSSRSLTERRSATAQGSGLRRGPENATRRLRFSAGGWQ